MSQSLADATQYAAALVAEARTSALHAHEAAMEEVNERLAAVEGREAVIAERHKHLRERREIFDDRRFAYRKRRDEIEERRARVAEQGAEIDEMLRAKAALDRDAAALLVLERDPVRARGSSARRWSRRPWPTSSATASRPARTT